MSRAHLRIAGASGGYKVEDLGSTNGTFVDGRRVKKPARCRHGSIVLFGNHAGVFRRVSDDELAAIEEEAAAPFGPVATMSPALAVTAGRAAAAGGRRHDLLFVGETGVGKEVYARAVHAASGAGASSSPSTARRCRASWWRASCSATRAARTPPRRARSRGWSSWRTGGRCCSTRSATCRARLQAKLFRFLQDRQVLPLGVDAHAAGRRARHGGHQPAWRDVGAVGPGRRGWAPSRSLIPPLRERSEDIGALVAHFGGAGVAAGWSRRRSARCASTTGPATCASWMRS